MQTQLSPLAVANYFIQKSFDTGEELTPMKLVKLVYIAHGWHLGLKGDALINEAVQAWKYGPVITSLYHSFKAYGNQQITKQESELTSGFQFVTPFVSEKTEQDFLNRIWEVYGKMNALQLSTLTHQPNTPWDIIWNQKEGKKVNGAIIPNDIIETHYKSKMNQGAQVAAVN